MFTIICPKCKGDKFEFDVHCDDCTNLSYRINKGKKQLVADALSALEYCFKHESCFYIVIVPRKDHEALTEILNEL